MRRFTCFLCGILGIILITGFALTPDENSKSDPIGFALFLKEFTLIDNLPYSFASHDFNPMSVVADEEGVYVNEEGIPIDSLMLSPAQLLRWIKGSKQANKQLVTWLEENNGKLNPNWCELFAGIHVSLPDLEILSVHNYTAYSASNGGFSQNWLLYFSKKGKLLKTIQLKDDVYSSMRTFQDDDALSYWQETTESVSNVFTIRSKSEVETLTDKYSTLEYAESIPRDTNYFQETISEPMNSLIYIKW